MVGIEIVVRMDDDDRALIERQCNVMEALIDKLKESQARECEKDQRRIKDLMSSWKPTEGNYTEPTAGQTGATVSHG